MYKDLINNNSHLTEKALISLLIDNGFIIKYKNNKMKIFENKYDEQSSAPLTIEKGESFSEIFVTSIKKIKEYYNR